MSTLRGPDGCPWDREQDMRSLRRYTLEEAYEVIEAIDAGDPAAVADELGDLLLQVVFLAQIGAEAGDFDITDAIGAIIDKLVRRHPHVFGDVQVADADEVVRNWETIKTRERRAESLLDDVPAGLPGLARAHKLGKRAAQMGFDWPTAGEVVQKVREELGELEAELTSGEPERIEEELGDLLLSLASLARHLDTTAELCLNRANAKFERRFRQVEAAVAAGRIGSSLEELEAEWQRAKLSPRDEAEQALAPGDSGHEDAD